MGGNGLVVSINGRLVVHLYIMALDKRKCTHLIQLPQIDAAQQVDTQPVSEVSAHARSLTHARTPTKQTRTHANMHMHFAQKTVERARNIWVHEHKQHLDAGMRGNADDDYADTAGKERCHLRCSQQRSCHLLVLRKGGQERTRY